MSLVEADDVRERVRAIVADMAPVVGEVTGETRLSVDLGFDSLQLLELVTALEEHFRLAADDDAMDIETVGDVEERVLGMVREQGATGPGA